MLKEPLSTITIKTLLAVAIFVGVGTIIVGGGLLIGNYGKVSEPIKENIIITNNETKEEIIVEEEIKDETADWKTYRNEEYGFEMKYPDDILLKESSNIAIQLKKRINLSYKDIYDFEVSVRSKDAIKPTSSNDFEKLEIDFHKATWRKVLGLYYYEIVEIYTEDYAYELIFTNWQIEGCSSEIKDCKKTLENLNNQEKQTIKKHRQTLNQILSTFKFIEKR